MKKTTFAFVGLLACVLSVSCEDKLLDDEKKNSPENSDSDSFKSVLDSSFVYVDGKLNKEARNSYTQSGLVEKAINKVYNRDGSLKTNDEALYTYSDSKGDNYVCISSSNGVELKKEEVYYSGNIATHVSNKKGYVKHGGDWFLKTNLYVKTENYRGYGYNFSYMIYNGQRIPVQRIVLIDSQDDPATGKMLYMERINYIANYSTDPSDPDGLTISALGNGSWRKTIQRYNSKGETLYKENLASDDSITWNCRGGMETKCDIKGNIVYVGHFSGDGEKYGKTYTTYTDDYRFISSYYYDFKNNGADSVLSTYKRFYYSNAGVLDSAEMVYDMNMIAFLPLEMSHIESDIYLGVGQSNAGGAKCVIQFDANGNPVSEKLYRMDDNGEIDNTARVHSTLTYDSDGRRTGYVVNVLVDGNWVEIESANSVYDSQGRELSSHVTYTGLPEGAACLKSEMVPSSYAQYEFSSRKEYDSYGNVSHVIDEEFVTKTNGRDVISKTEEFYSTIKVK